MSSSNAFTVLSANSAPSSDGNSVSSRNSIRSSNFNQVQRSPGSICGASDIGSSPGDDDPLSSPADSIVTHSTQSPPSLRPLESRFDATFCPDAEPASFTSLENGSSLSSSQPTPTLQRRKKRDLLVTGGRPAASLRPRGASVDSVLSSPGCIADPGRAAATRDSRDFSDDGLLLVSPGGRPRGLSLDDNHVGTSKAHDSMARQKVKVEQQKYLRPRGTSLDSVVAPAPSQAADSTSLDSPAPTTMKRVAAEESDGWVNIGGRHSPDSVLNIDQEQRPRAAFQSPLSKRTIGTSLDTIITPLPSPPQEELHNAPLKLKNSDEKVHLFPDNNDYRPTTGTATVPPSVRKAQPQRQRLKTKKFPPNAPRRRTVVGEQQL